MTNDKRHSPDALLTHVLAEESRQERGKLRLFFGMAAGVGKTYAMLSAARECLAEGVDVCIGLVETHGRPETQALMEGIPLIPRKKLEYRGTIQEEMDLDAVLERKPKLVLVDELAHTNIPGSRHEKRYQDVIEILDLGIDVYSTMNVQHLESRADIVRLITAVEVRETVPDTVLDLVDQIELIDITPTELIERLKEGKVYPGRLTQQALDYFFQEGNLSALRELSLRVTANKIERDMRGPAASLSAPATTGESKKLLVAISHSPFSERLIRTARRIVDDLEIPWVAVNVDTGKILDPRDHDRLIKNIDLAESMGAETLTLHGSDIADAINDYIKGEKILQMIVGHSVPQKGWRRFLKSPPLVEKLIRKNPDLDITVLQQPAESKAKKEKKGARKLDVQWSSYLKAVSWVFLMAPINYILSSYIGYKAVGFLFLLLIVVLSVFFPFTSVLLAAILSALVWDYFFIPPPGGFSISDPEDVMMLIAFFVITVVTGFLTYRLRTSRRFLKEREEKTRALYEILQSMTLVKGTAPVIDFALSKIRTLFDAECCILLMKNGGLSEFADYGSMELTENDRAVAAWSLNRGRKAGWSTDTLPLSSVLCLALKSGEERYGVLVFRPRVDRKLTPDQESLLISIANQIGIVIAKQKYDDDSRQASLLKESERMHQAILNCVSHELRTPLTAIMGAATALQSHLDKRKNQSLFLLADEIVSASERLNYVFENLLEVSRIDSGMIKLKDEWFDPSEIVHASISRHASLLADHKIEFSEPSSTIYLLGDFELMVHAFSNLLMNAVHYSPKESEIAIAIAKSYGEVTVDISDKGSGIPEHLLSKIFDKFYRLPGTPSGGLGLGLSIAKSIVEFHGGRIAVNNNPKGGATFSMILPYKEPPQDIQK